MADKSEQDIDEALDGLTETFGKNAKARRRLSSEFSIEVSTHRKNGKSFRDCLCQKTSQR